jgi:YfiR/HmsC-like
MALLPALLCGLAARPLLAQSPPTEDDVKAVYLFNFSRFVRYPAGDPAAPSFDICLVGRNGIATALQSTVSKETVGGHPVRILQMERAVDARACAIVYLGPSEASHIDKDLAALEGSNALTVSDLPQFTEHGGMIQFVLANNRVRFAVNLSSAEHARLALSSELLKVALSVKPAPTTETP